MKEKFTICRTTKNIRLFLFFVMVMAFYTANIKAQSSGSLPDKKASSKYPLIYANLLSSNDHILLDGVAAGFANCFSANVDGDDAQKLWNFGENIALVRNGSTLAIEFRPMPKLSDTLFYRLYLKQQPYTLQIFSLNLSAKIPRNAWLVDKYLGTRTEVNLYDTTLYDFTPNADTNSYRNRFMLVLNRKFTGTPVQVTKALNQSNPNTTGNAATIAGMAAVTVYPNPLNSGKVMLRFNNTDKGNYAIAIFNPNGDKLEEKQMAYYGGNIDYPLEIKSSWPAGIYTISITNKISQKTIRLQLAVSK